MLDEFPALGRLDFFESALAFMAGYGLKSFLIAQSLNQIEKAYGQNNSILDNCHVRVSLRDQRRAHRQARVGCARHGDRDAGDEELCRPPAVALARPSDGLAPGDGAAAADARRGDAAPARRRAGAGLRRASRSAPRRRATTRIRQLAERASCRRRSQARSSATGSARPDDWSALPRSARIDCRRRRYASRHVDDPDNAGIRREPELPEHEEIAPEPRKPRRRNSSSPRTSPTTTRSGAASLQPQVRGHRPPGRARSRRRHRAVRSSMRTKHTFRLPPDLAGKLADYADRKRVPQALDRRDGAGLVPVAGWRRAAGGALAPPARPADPAGRAARARMSPSRTKRWRCSCGSG